MAKFATLRAMEVAAQFYEDDMTANAKITTKPNVKWLRVEYLGAAQFAYFLDGKTARETSREFAHDVLMQEIAK